MKKSVQDLEMLMRETSLTKMAIYGFLSMKNRVKWDMAGTKDLIFPQLVIFLQNVRLAVFDLFNLVLELLVVELPILQSMMNDEMWD